jgi:flagellar FliL protein
MANRVENGKPATDKPATNGAADAKNGAAAAPPAAAAAPGGVKAFLPLIANLVLMPVLAYAMTAFVLVPKLAKSTGGGAAAADHGAAAEGEHGAAAEQSHGAKEETKSAGAHGATGKGKTAVSLSKKTLVNVSGTMGTRYLLAEFMLVGSNPAFKEKVEKADAELRDAAATALSVKTISDLEKPGVRNLVRTELITVFNTILGKGTVQEIYLTEFAIQ